MQLVTLGKAGLVVNKNGFGALPIQRVERTKAVALLQRALDAGINYFDTAHTYSDSEEKLGAAFYDRRSRVIISTKSGAKTPAELREHLELSLRRLQTDYIDLFQLHNPACCPKPGDGSGLYEALLSFQREGKIRYIGITNHRLPVAREAVASGFYDTLQFPFSYLASAEEVALVASSKERNMGFIAMKALSGGLITNAAAAYAYLSKFDTVEPIWGIQRETELDEFLSFQEHPPALTDALKLAIERDRRELSGDFCRGCGYCMPCPMGIQISTCARMSLLLRRAPSHLNLTPKWQAEMKKIDGCLHCGQCMSRCPYGLDTPALLKKNYEDYKTFLTD